MSLMHVLLDSAARPDLGPGRRLFTYGGELELLPHASAGVRIRRTHLASLALGEVISTGHMVQVGEYLATTVLVPLQGRLTTRFLGLETTAAAGQMLILPPGSRMTVVQPTDTELFRALVLTIPTADTRHAMDMAEMSTIRRKSMESSAFVVSAQIGTTGSGLSSLLKELRQDASEGLPRAGDVHLTAEHLLQLFSEVLLQERQAGISVKQANAMDRIVRRALDYMIDSHSDVQSVVQIANACGISARMLEHAFQYAWGITPKKALNIIRLQAARRLLLALDRDATVTEVAMACGFNHLGRFSAAYRREFGEPPSLSRCS